MKFDLLKLHKIMKEKGYHYFIGNTNDREEIIFISFSTGCNSHGDYIELVIKDKIEFDYWEAGKTCPIKSKKFNNDKELFTFLQSIIVYKS